MKRWRVVGLILLSLVALTGVVRLSFPRNPPPATAASVADQMFALHFDLTLGEVVRFIPFGSSPMRFSHLSRGMGGMTAAKAQRGGLIVYLAGGSLTRASRSHGNGRLDLLVQWCGELTDLEIDVPPELAKLPVNGDWVYRSDAPREQRLAVLEQFLRRELHRPIVIRKRLEPRPALIATGNFQLKPLGRGPTPRGVQLFTQTLGSSMTGGGTTTAQGLLRTIESLTMRRMIDQTDHFPGLFEFCWDPWVHEAAKDEHKLDLLLANVTEQTGLHFEKTTRDVEIFFVGEEGTQTPATMP